jgi:hypothetical protein
MVSPFKLVATQPLSRFTVFHAASDMRAVDESGNWTGPERAAMRLFRGFIGFNEIMRP